jgi:hypothetical protein
MAHQQRHTGLAARSGGQRHDNGASRGVDPQRHPARTATTTPFHTGQAGWEGEHLWLEIVHRREWAEVWTIRQWVLERRVVLGYHVIL